MSSAFSATFAVSALMLWCREWSTCPDRNVARRLEPSISDQGTTRQTPWRTDVAADVVGCVTARASCLSISPREPEDRAGRPPRIRLVRIAHLVVLGHARPVGVDVAADIEAGLGRFGRKRRRREKRVNVQRFGCPGLVGPRHQLGNTVAIDV